MIKRQIYRSKRTIGYTLLGVGIGLAFPIISTLLEINMSDLPITGKTIFETQMSTPLLWMIDTAPFILGYLLYLTGTREEKYVQLSNYLQEDLNDWVSKILEEKALYETLFQNIPAPVVTLDIDHKIQAANHAFEALFGYTQKEIQGKELDAIITDHESYGEANINTTQVQQGSPIDSIGIRKTKDNGLVEVEIRGVPILIDGHHQGALAIYTDVTENKKLERELHESLENLEILATIDPLTGLLNRRAIVDYAQGELERAKRNVHNMCVAVVDIDRCKEINDQHGHLVGDVAIKKIGETIKKNCRIYDRVGRWGGDEFMIIISDIACDDVHGFTERIRKEINETQFKIRGAGTVQLDVSIGVACVSIDKDFNLSINDLFNQADKALYEAKENGRNQVSVYTSKESPPMEFLPPLEEVISDEDNSECPSLVQIGLSGNSC